MNKADIILKNGRIVDPSQGVNKIGNLAIKNGKIIDCENCMTAETEINVIGCIVTPGLIDFHAHIFDRATDSGINPDISMIPQGVTTVVDAGSSGVSNYRSFIDVLSKYAVKTKLFLHVSPTGQATHQYLEPLLPDTWNIEKFKIAFENYGDKILGLKIRISKNIVRDQGLNPLVKLLAIGDILEKNVVVHVTDPPCTQDKVAGLLRKKDVFCHVYNGTGSSIFDEKGIINEVLKAKERGVFFDCSHGGANFSFETAEKAVNFGFFPDIISTDLTVKTWCKKPVYGLTNVMTKMLYLGMNECEIIKCVTDNPAKAMNLSGKTGTLRTGAVADVAVLKIIDGQTSLLDSLGNRRIADRRFEACATILDGTIVSISPCLWQ